MLFNWFQSMNIKSDWNMNLTSFFLHQFSHVDNFPIEKPLLSLKKAKMPTHVTFLAITDLDLWQVRWHGPWQIWSDSQSTKHFFKTYILLIFIVMPNIGIILCILSLCYNNAISSNTNKQWKIKKTKCWF